MKARKILFVGLERFFCFTMQDYLLNCWEETPCVVPISNEEIVAVSWLQSSGVVFNLHTLCCIFTCAKEVM